MRTPRARLLGMGYLDEGTLWYLDEGTLWYLDEGTLWYLDEGTLFARALLGP